MKLRGPNMLLESFQNHISCYLHTIYVVPAAIIPLLHDAHDPPYFDYILRCRRRIPKQIFEGMGGKPHSLLHERWLDRL